MRFIVLLIFLFASTVIFSQYDTLRRPKVGLVLSGGGAKGLAHIGVLKVLEEAGIPIDFIGGTSMGSIVGGLYSIGYSPDELKSIAINMNWDSLLTDEIARRNLSFEEKEENARYFVSFPLKEKKIGLPSGAISGQNIYGFFNRMASPVYRENNFLNYPIPFICIATDIENAEDHVLSNGYLPQAMRASMAIPSVFSPEEIGGKIYVDGGVLNNFPVVDVKKMGADILIGVDVGFRAQPRKVLGSLVGILNQSMYAFTKEEVKNSRKECQIIIDPRLENYNVMSFNDADSIIAQGELAARAMLPQLRALADSLNRFSPHQKNKNTPERFKSIFIKELEINGLKLVPKEFVFRKLQFEIPSEISLSELESGIAMIYGTQFFTTITYRLVPLPEGAKLILELSEKNTNFFKVGIHYDSDFKTALLLNATYRNLLAPGSKLSMDLALGENLAFNGLLYLNTGWNSERMQTAKKKLFPDFGIRVNAHKLEVFQFDKEKRIASYDFSDFTLNLFWQANPTNNTALGGGILGDYSWLANRVGQALIPESESLFLNFHAFYKIDTYDKDFYPTHGSHLTTEIKYVKDISDDAISRSSFFQGSVRLSNAFPIGRKFTLLNHFFAGTSTEDSIPVHYSYYLGGLGGTYLRGLVPFVGLKYMQLAGSHAIAVGSDIRAELWKDNFLTLKINACKAAYARKNIFSFDDITYGGGISYGYKSAIGPMEVTFMTSNSLKGLGGFINIGYWF